MSMIKSFRLYFADFETFTTETQFFKKHIQYKKDGTIDYSKS